MPPTVLYRVDGPVATITLNRPERRNAVSLRLLEELRDTLANVAGDAQVRAVRLDSAGDHFCVGSDLTGSRSERIVQGVDPDEDERRLLDVTRIVTLLREMPKPSIAVIRGGCAGVGIALALACDLRYAADTALFNTGYLSAALSGDLGISWLLAHTVGPAKARELMLLPGKVAAGEALAAGLVTAVATDEALDGLAEETAGRLAAAAPAALAEIRRNLDDALVTTLADYLPVEARRILRLSSSEDVKEARAAFAEKRPARFTGR